MSSKHENLAAALAAAQAAFGEIKKTKTVSAGSYSYNYAPWDAILAQVTPILSLHGLALSQGLTHEGGLPSLRTTLLHESGERLEDLWPIASVPEDDKKLGSRITYLRRYAGTAMLGVQAEDDDDAGRMDKPKPKQQSRPSTPPAQKKVAAGNVKDLWIAARARAEKMGCDGDEMVRSIIGNLGHESTKDILVGELAGVMRAIETYGGEPPGEGNF